MDYPGIRLSILATLCMLLVIKEAESDFPKGINHLINGNLLIGRGDRLSASSTCGLHSVQKYCIVSHLEDKKKCFKCDSRPGELSTTSHRIQNVIYRRDPKTRAQNWWQSENGKENVTIRLDLESEFYFTHLIMWFRTFRPAALIVERSSDNGLTWKPYRYFAENCAVTFPGLNRTKSYQDPSEVTCEETYSSSTPVTNGEVILKIIPPDLENHYDPYSTNLQNLMRITNLRVNFTKLHTLGDDLLDKRQEIQEKYYYAIYEMVVRGFCWCYGHAENCLPLNENVKDTPGMIHGRCDCVHNTTGINCKYCKDTHNDLPWKPAIGHVINACQKCKCNEHALRCNFSSEVYQQSGHTSGSVCIDCEHNTMGNNCERCKPMYYHDPQLPISHPDTCLPCNCNSEGAVDGGLCNSPKDVYGSRVCHCKENVEGDSCDVCKPGFWNLQSSNPKGCEPCTCDLRGTINGNRSCDPYTGICLCEPFVIGKDCNQCFLEHWGLSNDTYGCLPCNCDVGGSYSSNCDVVTGKCMCYPHLTGRTCNEVDQNYFLPDIDMVYEAEVANHSDNCQPEVKEWPREGTPYWTGSGFTRVHDNCELVFIIDNIPNSMEYDLIVRHDKVKNDELVDVTAQLTRPDTPVGLCSNVNEYDDEKQLYFQPDNSFAVSSTPLCLESEKTYKLKLTFSSSNNQLYGQAPTILIDSIVLVPRVDSLDIFTKTPKNRDRLRSYVQLGCHEKYYLPHQEPVEVCKEHQFSISIRVFKNPPECKCNATGSISTLCNSLGGKCLCKPKVIGRTCDKCAEGTYGFFQSDGCKDCDCNSVGAKDNICDPYSGQCNCNNGTYGRSCDQCAPGSWDFPHCKPCQCNGHAHICNGTTGECIGCTDFTAGHYCDKCADGYYGEPMNDIPCRPCSCPDTIESGHSFASSCVKNSQDDVICLCKDGYRGPRCDKCDDNYFGHPERVGGSCQPCNCSDNTDLSQPGNCHPHTGECLKCLYNTTGKNCQQCLPHYFGNASEHNCQKCPCNILGTDSSKGPCNPVTGECHCLPNVEGKNCDRCTREHCLIGRGTGCVHCACDPVGSQNQDCNMFDGACKCRDGFGGMKCNECQANYWGDPKKECFPCDCDIDGAVTGTCNQTTGHCLCIEGITGEKCNMCSRGFSGEAPLCDKCGDCFDNWDLTITCLSDETENITREAKDIRQTGTSGYNAIVFDRLSNKIDEVNKTLINTKSNVMKLNDLKMDVDNYSSTINVTNDLVNDLKNKVEAVIYNVSYANMVLSSLENSTEALKKMTNDLSNNSTNLQEKYLKGALNITREAGLNAKNVSNIEKKIETQYLIPADRQCKRTEKFLNKDNETFTSTEHKNEAKRGQLDFELSTIEKKLPDLNEKICDGRGDPCDGLCGGAACDKCGSSASCENGAVRKVIAGLDIAEKYKASIKANLSNADGLRRNISNAMKHVSTVHKATVKVHDMVNDIKKTFETQAMGIVDVKNKLEKFIEELGAKPTEVNAISESVVNMHIQLQPQQIKDLASEINSTLASLTNINTTLEATKDDHKKADDLKMRSDDAKKDAEDILAKAQEVISELQAAEKAQHSAKSKIDNAKDDIATIQKQLQQIVSETDSGWSDLNYTKHDVEKLKTALKRVQTEIFQNKNKVDQILMEAGGVSTQVENTDEKLNFLKNNYAKVLDKVTNLRQPPILDKTKVRVQELLDQAQRLSLKTNARLSEFKDADALYNKQKKQLASLTSKIDDLTNQIMEYTKQINKKAKHHRECKN
ncbi:laminin subunit beta-1 [Cimex lectularius]|uniref:Laminin subunit beta-1 n=1 Tax=Cimex lectularius TaxID=79782 RepID=A0A8I6SN36_CIMLE|nr:laminin subunit beta-1 [Cimex lectularius]